MSRRGSEIELVLGTGRFAPGYDQGPRPELGDSRRVQPPLNAADHVRVAVAEHYAAIALSIPVYPRLTDARQDRVVLELGRALRV